MMRCGDAGERGEKRMECGLVRGASTRAAE